MEGEVSSDEEEDGVIDLHVLRAEQDSIERYRFSNWNLARCQVFEDAAHARFILQGLLDPNKDVKAASRRALDLVNFLFQDGL